MAINILRNDSEMYVAEVTTAAGAASTAVPMATSDIMCTRVTFAIKQAVSGSAYILPSSDVSATSGIQVNDGEGRSPKHQESVANPGERINLRDWWLVTDTAQDGIVVVGFKAP